ncbi:DUF3145 domain-containing protein [Dermatophilus congolensis]|uniref:Protein of uncharacterized function (DUF3145) n=1 Tax=Dermatophilus congolensis TaxID=1863 RepID=A0A239VL09_9MICO|nr:DUF3145 domain-containing protein [Dermatophilus congolensis]MBO3129286.1 DUF3145 domain-containing protein [Dermatophilus congolensis]MBO3132082.1 DUF3145 domain-containing protein [Dermatophilus congolensis]MBO3133762.1 DUF3145 domain-containing protein [Dermatophilus congolensis]MBO3135993.1 DUF3145 domain-containing protein [Dermatophilus congolensis]MBO3138234.1 DUF3145 domain-containing protein [Dermatophilus congolensis]
MSGKPTGNTTRGAVYIHSAPAALCPHISWALESVLGGKVDLDWSPQPLGRSLMRADLTWYGEPGTGAAIASAMRGWENLRYEVTEEPSPGLDGSRWSHTPSLGIHHTWISASGDAVINEDRIRAAMRHGNATALRHELDQALGTAWDVELDNFRHAGDGRPERWLYRVS